MMPLLRLAGGLRRSRRGATAMEFALIIPVWMLFFFGIVQVGLVFWASAGLQNGLGEGARQATLYPRVSAETIKSTIKDRTFGVVTASFPDPTITYGKIDQIDYADISVQYDVTMPLFGISVYTFRYSRRAYLS